jgi:uncharacterized SAM-binding protein YcdF (DUF218 family)
VTPSKLSGKVDGDARFVLGISILVLFGTAGILLILILIRILYQAKTATCTFPAADSVCLVFGKRLVDDQPDPEFIARLDRLIACGCSSAILMGGQSPGNRISEARAGLEYLRGKGVDLRAVHLEQDSRSTLENLRNSRELIRNRNAVIISNRYHLARCGILAKSFSIRYEICAAEPDFRLDSAIFIKCLSEAFYIHWFYSGKYWATMTRNQRMLNKIT